MSQPDQPTLSRRNQSLRRQHHPRLCCRFLLLILLRSSRSLLSTREAGPLNGSFNKLAALWAIHRRRCRTMCLRWFCLHNTWSSFDGGKTRPRRPIASTLTFSFPSKNEADLLPARLSSSWCPRRGNSLAAVADELETPAHADDALSLRNASS